MSPSRAAAGSGGHGPADVAVSERSGARCVLVAAVRGLGGGAELASSAGGDDERTEWVDTHHEGDSTRARSPQPLNGVISTEGRQRDGGAARAPSRQP